MNRDDYCKPTMAALYLWAMAVTMAVYNQHYRDPWA
jgi:hypothetical protein